MVLDIICDYSLLKEKILEVYPYKNENQSMTSFCQDLKIKTARLKRIFANRDYFNKREEYWACQLLNIEKDIKDDYFSNVILVIEK